MQENADGFVELGKGIKISPPEEMEAVESRAALVVRPDTSTQKDDKLVLIGSPMRKVHIPVSVYRKVFRQALPQAAVGLVLPAVFPQALLTSGGLPEDPAQGVKMLDPNKIEAIRGKVCRSSTSHDVSERARAER
ncbi:uncharacterized protein si:zfos-905g2.1 [Hypomesus transpacificus]|uniref:uncharacterized protein si:zfos-905g2.1 n=1 Tax=Hypomesus transpacificus TaxID=137520 RepID=UPI001F080A18|nr:uncharacterized protein si:zfos-905g2.1 [Hypomesus transpacificus]